eukprot:m.272962 g.272962  ORF g.272962 m.272962 type:complete len:757 (-) comp19335_c0_seq7:294-2564(-)
MKFGKYLASHAIPEWRSEHIDYKGLKKSIKWIVANHPAPPVTTVFAGEAVTTDGHDADLERRSLEIASSEEEQQFLEKLRAEVAKLDRFVTDQLLQIEERWAALLDQLDQLQTVQRAVISLRSPKRRQNTNFAQMPADEVAQSLEQRSCVDCFLGCLRPPSDLVRVTRKIKGAFLEFYRNLDLLVTFQQLNVTGFGKALKKHDKNTGLQLLSTLLPKLEQAEFNTRRVQDYVSMTERYYTSYLMGGNRVKAMEELRVPPKAFSPVNWTTVFVGFAFGFLTLTGAIAIVVASQADDSHFPEFTRVFRGFRGSLLVALMPVLIGVDMYAWHTHYVNYPLIFNLDLREHALYLDLLRHGGYLLLAWCAALLLYLLTATTATVAPEIAPLLFVIFAVVYLLNPTDITSPKENRYWLLNVLGRICLAPFKDVKFEDFWLADQLTSMTAVLLDIEFAICFASYESKSKSREGSCGSVKYGLRPVLTVLPFWFRFAQCLRRYRDTHDTGHLLNAGKYSTSFAVVTFSSLATSTKEDNGEAEVNTYFILWIIAAVVNMTYSFSWDVLRDWGLFRRGAKHRFLRNKIEYDPRWYYFAIVADFLFRCSWTLSLSIGFFDTTFLSDWLVLVLAVVEIFRRCMWNVFRLENEHSNNCGRFRATREIPLPFNPLSSSWQPDDEFDVHVPEPARADESSDEGEAEGEDSGSSDNAYNDVVATRQPKTSDLFSPPTHSPPRYHMGQPGSTTEKFANRIVPSPGATRAGHRV